MTLTLADNPSLTPELVAKALAKCKDFFIGLSFSLTQEIIDDGEEDFLEIQKSHQAALRDSTAELEKVALSSSGKLEFTVKIGNKSVLFFPEYSDLGKNYTRELVKILTDDEIAALYLIGAKNSEKDGEQRLLGMISSGKLDEKSNILGVDYARGNLASEYIDIMRKRLKKIKGLTSQQVRQLLQ